MVYRWEGEYLCTGRRSVVVEEVRGVEWVVSMCRW